MLLQFYGVVLQAGSQPGQKSAKATWTGEAFNFPFTNISI